MSWFLIGYGTDGVAVVVPPPVVAATLQQYTGKLSWEGRRTKRERLEDAKLERERVVRTAAFHKTIEETIRPKPLAIIEPPDEYDAPEPVAAQSELADARPLEIAELEVTAAKARVVTAEITAKSNLAEKTQKTAARVKEAARIQRIEDAQREYDDALATVLLLHA